MSYRPITDVWLLTRAKLKGGRKYYGAYLGGFAERARRIIGCSLDEPMLHVCGGMARHYPYAGGFGVHDKTMDIDFSVEPDFIGDAAKEIPLMSNGDLWPGMLIDPPYSIEDATHYSIPNYPAPNALVRNALSKVRVGRKVGIIHYMVPQFPKETAKCIAIIGVNAGFNNRLRAFTVFERLK